MDPERFHRNIECMCVSLDNVNPLKDGAEGGRGGGTQKRAEGVMGVEGTEENIHQLKS